MKNTTIRPLPGYILVEPVKEESQAGGIYLPEDINDKPSKGKIVALSNIFIYEGQIMSIDGMTLTEGYENLKVGKTVVYKKWVNQEVKDNGKEYLLVKYDEILGIIE